MNATVLGLPHATTRRAAEAPALPRGLLPMLASLALLIMLLIAARAARPALDRPLRAVEVQGQLTRLSAAQIAAAANLDAEARVLDVDLDAVRARIEALPWVAHARVSRRWPDRLRIRVWEREPYARWGEAGLVDTEAHSFAPRASEIPPNLPQLAGPAGREAEVIRAYQALGAALAGSVFVPSGLALDARGEWRLATVRGITLRLGTGDPQAKTALILGAVSRTLEGKLDQVEAVDLRYTNGFAVAWASHCASPTPGMASPATANARPRMGGPGCEEAAAAAPRTAATEEPHR